MSPPADAFVEPDWESPVDVEGYLVQVPAESKVKGLLFRTALREAEARAGQGPTDKTFRALADYPLTEFIQVLVGSAHLAHPDVSVAEGLRRLGHRVFPGLKESKVVRRCAYCGNEYTVRKPLHKCPNCGGHLEIVKN